MKQLSVVIITYNEEQNILRCIESVKDLAGEVLIIDSNSTDRTVEICMSSGCRVIIHSFEGYGQQKQFGVENAKNDWILSLDADEIVTQDLVEEINKIMGLDSISFSGYYIPFSLFYLGKILRFSGTGHEVHLRLFDRNKGKFTDSEVHESIEVNGTIGRLSGKVIHYSYRDISHHLSKINTYTTRAAIGYTVKGKTYSKTWVAFKFPVSFFVYYFIRLGIFDGFPGFMWSFFAAFYGSVKIAKTIEMTGKP
jgi:glycosyltransferase involved in cell wall biosynthesis